jgi:hypothetical protein
VSNTVQLDGQVMRKRVNPGSKSDHEAVVIVSARGEFKLRRQGGPPFGDADLHALVGKRIRAAGIVSAGQFIASQIDVLD